MYLNFDELHASGLEDYTENPCKCLHYIYEKVNKFKMNFQVLYSAKV